MPPPPPPPLHAVLMTLAGVEWEAGAFARAQEVLQQSAELCSAHPTWRLNLAHAILAQEGGRLQVSTSASAVAPSCVQLRRALHCPTVYVILL